MVPRLLNVLLVSVVLLLLVGCRPAVVGISIDQGDITLAVGDSASLSATVRVANGASTGVNWSSGDETVATVSGSGVVSAEAVGTTLVTATSAFDDSHTASVTVTVVFPGGVVEEGEVEVDARGATIVTSSGVQVLVSAGVLDPTGMTVTVFDVLPADYPDGARLVGARTTVAFPRAALRSSHAGTSVARSTADDEVSDYGFAFVLPASTPHAEVEASYVQVRITLNGGRYYQILHPFKLDEDGDAIIVFDPALLGVLDGVGVLPDLVEITLTPYALDEGLAPSLGRSSTAETGLYRVSRLFFDAAHDGIVCPSAFDQDVARVSSVERVVAPASSLEERTPLVLVHGWQVLANDFAAMNALIAQIESAEVNVSPWFLVSPLLGLAGSEIEMTEVSLRFEPHVCGWAHFINAFYEAGLDEAYDLYTFAYDSQFAVSENAERLAAELRGALPGRAAVIVAHSMGGLVTNLARLGLDPHDDARIRHVITLGTPFRGTTALLCDDATCTSASMNPDFRAGLNAVIDDKVPAPAFVALGPLGRLKVMVLAQGFMNLVVERLQSRAGTRDLAWDTPIEVSSELRKCSEVTVFTTPQPHLFPVMVVRPEPTPKCRVSEYSHPNPLLSRVNTTPGVTFDEFTAFVGDISVVESTDTMYDIMQFVFGFATGDSTDGIVPMQSGLLDDRIEQSFTYPGYHHTMLSGGGEPDERTSCLISHTDLGKAKRCAILADIQTVLVDLTAAELTVTPGSIGGLAPEGGAVSQQLRLTNTGGSTLVIGDISQSAAWLEIIPSGVEPLRVGESVVLDVTLRAGTLPPGTYESEVTITWQPTMWVGEPLSATVLVRFVVTASAAQHRLYGRITDAFGSPISGVVTSVEVGGVPFAAATDAAGLYDFSFYKGSLTSAQARIAKTGYQSAVTTVDFTLGSETELDAVLVPIAPSDILFYEDFETCGVGWVLDNAGGGLWNCRDVTSIQNRAYVQGYVSLIAGDLTDGFVPTPFAGSHALWYGDPMSGNFIGTQLAGDAPNSGGTSVSPHAGRLVSPPLDLGGVGAARLEGMTWYEVESVDIAQNQFDQMRVAVYRGNPLEGGVLQYRRWLNPPFEPPLQQADLPYTSGGNNRPALWVPFAVDLTSVAGAPDVYVVFEFETRDGRFNGFRGWLLDELHVLRGAGPAATSLVVPATVPTGR